MLNLQGFESEVHSAAIPENVNLLYNSYELRSRDRIPVWNDVVWRNYVPLEIKIVNRPGYQGGQLV